MPAEGDLAFQAMAESYVPSKFNIHPASDMLIFENKNALPRAYAVPHSIVLNSETQILSELQSPDFDPYQVVILEEARPVEESPNSFSFDSSYAQISLYEPNRVIVESNLPEPGWVVLTDLYYPGWTAEVDGQKEHIYQANYLFRAVPVPAGLHVITFQFWPPSFTYGLTASLIALFGLTLVIGFRWWCSSARS